MTFSNPDFTIFFDILFWFQWFYNIFSDEDLHIYKALCPKECNCSWYKEKSEATLMSLNCQFSNSSNFPNFEDTPNMFQEITILSLKGYTSLKILNSSNLVPGEWLCMYCLNKILWTCYLLPDVAFSPGCFRSLLDLQTMSSPATPLSGRTSESS